MKKILITIFALMLIISYFTSKTEYINVLPGPFGSEEPLNKISTIANNPDEIVKDDSIYLNFDSENYYINTVKPKETPIPMPVIKLKDFNNQ
jgi:hypothetical protein